MLNPSEIIDRLRFVPFFQRCSQALLAVLIMVLASVAGQASAHSVTTSVVDKNPPAGEPSERSSVPHGQGTRTIKLDMSFISFSAKSIFIEEGETIRFIIRNTSPIAHDFTIGTSIMQQGRRAMIGEMKDAETLNTEKGNSASYDAPHAVLVFPGETKQLVWKFTKSQRLEFGCNLPGHYELGMKGKFKVRPTVDYSVAFAAPDRHPEEVAAWPRKYLISIKPSVTGKLRFKPATYNENSLPITNFNSSKLLSVPRKGLPSDIPARSRPAGRKTAPHRSDQSALRRHLQTVNMRRRNLLQKHWRGLSEP